MANPNRVLANLPKNPLWEVFGWEPLPKWHSKWDESQPHPHDAAVAFAEELRKDGFEGVRVTQRGRSHNTTWHVMVPHKYIKESSRTKSRPTKEDLNITGK